MNYTNVATTFRSEYILLNFFFRIQNFFNNFNNSSNDRVGLKIKQLNLSNPAYLNVKINKFKWMHYLFSFKYNFLSFINFFRFWAIPLILALVALYFLMYIRLLNAPRHLFAWILILTLLFTLLSGFVFFVKKYRFAKFTSVIQQFWKRSFMLFWLIEGGLFLVFIFLTLNAAEEPVYMYDQLKMQQNHLFSWRLFILKAYPCACLVLFTQYLLYTIRWTTFSNQSLIILIITFLLLQVVWLEFYQFYHIVQFYSNGVWKYKAWNRYWVIKREARRTRVVTNYTNLCLLVKFWHLLFILGFWLFFVLRIGELNRIRYPLLAANNQNFLILYFFVWLYMYPWLKFFYKRFLNRPYYWFLTNYRNLSWRVFYEDFCLLYISFANQIFTNLINTTMRFSFDFYYWVSNTSFTTFDQHKKWFIRDYFLFYLYN